MGLSTHILDTALGRPATGVALVLSQLQDGAWQELGRGETDSDGRCKTLLGDASLAAATTTSSTSLQPSTTPRKNSPVFIPS